MENYSFKDFIDSVEDLNFHEMFEKAQERYHQLEREVRYRPKKRPRNYPAENLMGQVHRFLFWMHNVGRADGLADEDWALVERVCRVLVKKKQLKSSALDAFKPRPAGP
jgi:hypothetical protein